MSFLLDALKYNKNLPHQVVAWELLAESLTKKQEEDFKVAFRDAPPEPVKEFYASHPITQKILDRILELELPIEKPPTGYRAYIVGITGHDTNLKYIGNKLGRWDDAIGCLRVYHDGRVQVIGLFVGTTDPGRHYTFKPMQKPGAAMSLQDHFHEKIWQVGTHIKQRHCLVQWGNAISIRRDADQDGVRDASEPITRGNYGINFHSTHVGFASNWIGRYSAGCTVVKSVAQKDQLVNVVEASYDFTVSGGDRRVSYILLNGDNL